MSDDSTTRAPSSTATKPGAEPRLAAMALPESPLPNPVPPESISALRRLIATLGPEQSGNFFNHTDREYPW